jgi:2-polyprenyl-6-hydroxyphenyl methylase/3-demethylubiquinone-9 3-methyltransferase
MTTPFGFGDNWLNFASDLNEEHIIRAKKSLQRLLGRTDLSGLTFLDIGSGSGLFSLVARQLGARVHSFDFDPDSVACTQSLRNKYFPGDAEWTVEHGSILNAAYTDRLGTFDIVYSWGVLHHTGAMWTALERAASLVAPDGVLAIALYRRTPLCGAWLVEKRLYKAAPRIIQSVVRGTYKAAYFTQLAASGQSPRSFVRNYKSVRGMNWHHDVHDWLGGYPYESASPEDVKARLARLGFGVIRSVESPSSLGLFGTGCDEFVGRRKESAA